MPPSLAERFLRTGILQLGRFQSGDEFIPVRLGFEYLPAYPDLLQDLAAEAGQNLANFPVDRLVAVADALPFGIALSLTTNCSLVYSRGRGETAVFDLVGAYNAGHKAVLLTNIFEDRDALNPLIMHANRVGLKIQAILALVDLGTKPHIENSTMLSVIRLPDMVTELMQSGLIPEGQARAVLNWIEQQVSIHRRGAGVP